MRVRCPDLPEKSKTVLAPTSLSTTVIVLLAVVPTVVLSCVVGLIVYFVKRRQAHSGDYKKLGADSGLLTIHLDEFQEASDLIEEPEELDDEGTQMKFVF